MISGICPERYEMRATAELMVFGEETRRRLIATIARRVIEHADELTALDRAIGDGDHGINMRRGFEAVLADLDGLAAKPLPEALKAVGMALVMKVGGASGPLYGTLFMTLGKALPAEPGLDDLVAAFDQAIEAVKARGKSDVDQKTMLDVLKPARDALAGGRDVRAAADAAADATIPMKAVRGRASFLGERSIGHMDPGARSSALIIGAIVEVVEAAS
jgi:phosphoenolpyruvate---glycerone phosphotransferase subunit DhaL